jgi:hypothetical protein
MENANLSTIFISFGLNGGLITVAGFFIKKYLDRLEERGNANAVFAMVLADIPAGG